MYEDIPRPSNEKKCFEASDGCLTKFKDCHALHFSAMQKEDAGAEHEEAASLKSKFKGNVENYHPD